MTKYGNRRTTVDGITFDSKAEAAHYQELKLLERAGHISHLETHPRFLLQDKFRWQGKTIRAIYYEADFQYEEDGRTVVVDVKGRRTAVYQLKRKLFLKRYPEYEFREVKV